MRDNSGRYCQTVPMPPQTSFYSGSGSRTIISNFFDSHDKSEGACPRRSRRRQGVGRCLCGRCHGGKQHHFPPFPLLPYVLSLSRLFPQPHEYGTKIGGNKGAPGREGGGGKAKGAQRAPLCRSEERLYPGLTVGQRRVVDFQSPPPSPVPDALRALCSPSSAKRTGSP